MKRLTRTLIPLLLAIVESVRKQFAPLQQQTSTAYTSWQASHLSLPAHPLDDFCLQTAFMQFARLYFLQICEEYMLIAPRTPSEVAGLLHSLSWQEYPLRLLNELDPSFTTCFDWFTPDAQLCSSLYRLLSRFTLRELHYDLLGNIYSESFIEPQHRSEKGQFYTPAHIVDYMLAILDIPDIYSNDYTKIRDFVSKAVADLSCGSGSFLAAVAARKRTALQRMMSAGEMQTEDALRVLTHTITGFDVNPFACYLAKVNLLLQCLPLLAHRGQAVDPLDFHIYCADALQPGSVEQTGQHHRAFDYLLGNPPYVSAHESAANLRYRETIAGSGMYRLLHQKWDLFVPFFERNLHLLRPGTGKLSLIVSSGIETEGYADRLRAALCSQYRLLQLDFFPGLRLFPGTGIESAIISLENIPPGEQHEVQRRKHRRANCRRFETLPSLTQVEAGERVFRWRYNIAFDTLFKAEALPLCAIAYIGTGIEAQSSEGSDQQIDGLRQKRFTLHDVFLSDGQSRPADYPDDGVLGDDIDTYYLRRTRYVAYDSHLPYMRGPRYAALFRTPEKLVLGETSGGYYDTRGLFANHSVQVVVPWKALDATGALCETGVARVLRKSQQISAEQDLVSISEMVDLRYVLAILNSRFMRGYIASNLHEGTRKGRTYPDVWKRLPIKVAPAERQKELAELVERVQEQYKRTSIAQEERERLDALVDEIERLVREIYEQT